MDFYGCFLVFLPEVARYTYRGLAGVMLKKENNFDITMDTEIINSKWKACIIILRLYTKMPPLLITLFTKMILNLLHLKLTGQWKGGENDLGIGRSKE